MDFPIADLMDQESCYHKLTDILHPTGLCCPQCCRTEGLRVHRRDRRPVITYRCHACGRVFITYRCHACGRVFNIFTGTVFQGTSRSCAELLIILRGIAQGVTTAQLARELNRNRPRLLELRHAIQANALRRSDATPLPDIVAEVDEMYQNAGEKRRTALGSRRSAATPGQQRQGPRHMAERSSTRLRNRRA